MWLLCLATVLCHRTGAQPSDWHRATPANVRLTGAAYDEARGEFIVFGGRDFFYTGETWAWDGSAWRLRADNAWKVESNRATPLFPERPSARHDAALAYDSRRREIVLFGGIDGAITAASPEGDLNDTWTWNGTTWALRSTTGPSQRYGALMAYDGARGETILWGGSAAYNKSYSDTWAWNGEVWTKKADSGPVRNPYGSSFASMAYDAARQQVILVNRGETWGWNGSTWNRFPNGAVGIIAGTYSGLAYDSVRGKLVLLAYVSFGLGGYASAFTLFEWDGEKWNRVGPDAWNANGSANGPSERVDFRWVYDKTRRHFLYWNETGEMWSCDGARWVNLITRAPSRRSGHAMAYHGARGRSVVFGGGALTIDENLSDTWEWDCSRWQQLTTAGGPPGRAGHAMSYDQARAEVVLFGGGGRTRAFGDTWVLGNAGGWVIKADTGPPARFLHTIAYDARRQEVVLFGGRDHQQFFNDTWVWNGRFWSQRQAPGPPPRTGAAMSYDAEHGQIVLCGGSDASTANIDDTWTWDGQSWTYRTSGKPCDRKGHVMAYSAREGKVFLFGGGFGDMWSWDGRFWTEVPITFRFFLLESTAMAYDERLGVLVQFGGQNMRPPMPIEATAGGVWHFAPGELPKPKINSVVNAASYAPAISDGGWTAVLGANFTSTTRAWRADEIIDGKLPTSLDGVSVTVDGLPAAVHFISPSQLNIQAPATGKTGSVPVVVTATSGATITGTAEIRRNAPGVFMLSQAGGKYPAALIARGDGGVDFLGPQGLYGAAAASRPARPGEGLVLYATGLGPTNPGVSPGLAFSGAAPTVDKVTVTVGGVNANVTFAGLTGAGLYQLNVTVPAGLSPGDQLLTITVNGLTAQPNIYVPVAQ